MKTNKAVEQLSGSTFLLPVTARRHSTAANCTVTSSLKLSISESSFSSRSPSCISTVMLIQSTRAVTSSTTHSNSRSAEAAHSPPYTNAHHHTTHKHCTHHPTPMHTKTPYINTAHSPPYTNAHQNTIHKHCTLATYTNIHQHTIHQHCTPPPYTNAHQHTIHKHCTLTTLHQYTSTPHISTAHSLPYTIIIIVC